MWPWEHLAFGYVLYSLSVRALRRRSPTGPEALTLALATQLPDLIDKPLSWGLELFANGYAIGHSLLFAVPLAGGAVLLGRRLGRPAVGAALAFGYVSHLLGDVLSPLRSGEFPSLDPVLWPFVTGAGYETRYGLVGRFLRYFGRFLGEVTEPGNLPFVIAYLLCCLAVVGLWLLDGAPGVRTVFASVRSRVGGN